MEENLNIVYNEKNQTVQIVENSHLFDNFEEDEGDEVLICVSGIETADEVVSIVKRLKPNTKELASLLN